MRRVGNMFEYACQRSGCGYVIQATAMPDEPICPSCRASSAAAAQVVATNDLVADNKRLRDELESALRRVADLEDEVYSLRCGGAA